MFAALRVVLAAREPRIDRLSACSLLSSVTTYYLLAPCRAVQYSAICRPSLAPLNQVVSSKNKQYSPWKRTQVSRCRCYHANTVQLEKQSNFSSIVASRRFSNLFKSSENDLVGRSLKIHICFGTDIVRSELFLPRRAISRG